MISVETLGKWNDYLINNMTEFSCDFPSHAQEVNALFIFNFNGPQNSKP